jgi:plasmid stability protein
MTTLYVENVPRELYEALRRRARQRRCSIAAEVLSLTAESIPTTKQLKARQALLRKLERMHARPRACGRQFPSMEEMQREDRTR